MDTFLDESLLELGGNFQRTIQSADAMRENGLLGLLRSYKGIERMPIRIGDPYESDSILSEGVIASRSP
jgi:hypothetical protein